MSSATASKDPAALIDDLTTLANGAYPPFRSVAVIGAGVMGAQIAAHMVNAGLEAHLYDIAAEGKNKNAIVEGQFKKALKINPEPFFVKDAANRVKLRNLDEHFDRLGEADWIIEAIVEKMPIKQQLMERLEKISDKVQVISSNTSGLPLGEISAGRGSAFKKKFLGTHFFNPPRYLMLLEIIPTEDTDPEVVRRVAHFGRLHLGKGVVMAKDSPCFIGNRVGIYTMMHGIRAVLDQGYTIEEVDALTGTLIGRPRSATFRTADVVGLDTLVLVADSLYEAFGDDTYKVPDVVRKMVEEGRLGAKTKAGFYKKIDGKICSINFDTFEYEAPNDKNLKGLDGYKKERDLTERFPKLYKDKGRIGEFIREHFQNMIAFSAQRIPEISERPADVDRALKWGFGWEMGPFETWDALGFAAVKADIEKSGRELPAWVDQMSDHNPDGFYKGKDHSLQSYVPAQGDYISEAPPADQIRINILKKDKAKVIDKGSESTLLDMGDDVAIFEFHSKGHSLGAKVMKGLDKALDIVEEGDWRGLVIGHDGDNFSFGANLFEIAASAFGGKLGTFGSMLAGAAVGGGFNTPDDMIQKFQAIIQRIAYSPKPVVVAPHQRVLGGGCEMTMASCHPVADAETYIGLVELGVGVIPAGCGTMRLTKWAHRSAASDNPSDIQPWVIQAFEGIAMANVHLSARAAMKAGILPPNTTVVMNSDRRLQVAKDTVIFESAAGYVPPPVEPIMVLGRPLKGLIDVKVHAMKQSKFISEYDGFLAQRLGHIMAGGDLTAPQLVDEQYLLDLEREVFLSLLGEKKTQERIKHILTTKKPLRN